MLPERNIVFSSLSLLTAVASKNGTFKHQWKEADLRKCVEFPFEKNKGFKIVAHYASDFMDFTFCLIALF